MPTAQLQAFEQKFGGTMYVGYGLSEASPSVAAEREGVPRKPGSTGRAPRGRRGEDRRRRGRRAAARHRSARSIANGENISPGYYENPEATAETFRDGWLFTGDMGYMDDDGYLFVVERKKDLIIRAGLNIYPKDVEEVIHSTRRARGRRGGRPRSFAWAKRCAPIVVGGAPARTTAEELIAHCQANLAKYKTPKYVEFVDGLPRTGLGKIQKKEVRKMAAARFERAASE